MSDRAQMRQRESAISMKDDNRTAEKSRDYLIGFHDAVKAALNAIAAQAQRGDDERTMCARAQAIEAVSGLKP